MVGELPLATSARRLVMLQMYATWWRAQPAMPASAHAPKRTCLDARHMAVEPALREPIAAFAAGTSDVLVLRCCDDMAGQEILLTGWFGQGRQPPAVLQFLVMKCADNLQTLVQRGALVGLPDPRDRD